MPTPMSLIAELLGEISWPHLLAGLGAVLGVGTVGCEPRPPELFTEITRLVNLDESPPVWPDGRYQVPEISPTGIALFDYDDDGDLDIYQVYHPPPDQPDSPASNRLYQQQPDGTFINVAQYAGVDDCGYGNGVAIGDIDNDGDWDVYVLNLFSDVLYVNRGDGTFLDVTEKAGIRGSQMSTGGGFFDYDLDGDLDLYVAHYLVDDPSKFCAKHDGRRDYCGPLVHHGIADTLYRNQGDGTFVDVTQAAGLSEEWGGWGVICLDLTGDRWPDVYVANDLKPNQLYVNQGDGTFVDEAFLRGLAVNGAGNGEASMGISVGDVNADGRLDLFLTHLYDETNTLYVQSKAGQFVDRSATSGIGGPSFPYTGWGCGLVDFDHDGDLDVAFVNGRVVRGPVHENANVGKFWNHYAEPNHLFLNDGRGSFQNVSDRAGSFCSRVEVTHGLAFGDLARDGDVDSVTAIIDNTLRVFRNDAPGEGRTGFVCAR